MSKEKRVLGKRVDVGDSAYYELLGRTFESLVNRASLGAAVRKSLRDLGPMAAINEGYLKACFNDPTEIWCVGEDVGPYLEQGKLRDAFEQALADGGSFVFFAPFDEEMSSGKLAYPKCVATEALKKDALLQAYPEQVELVSVPVESFVGMLGVNCVLFEPGELKEAVTGVAFAAGHYFTPQAGSIELMRSGMQRFLTASENGRG